MKRWLKQNTTWAVSILIVMAALVWGLTGCRMIEAQADLVRISYTSPNPGGIYSILAGDTTFTPSVVERVVVLVHSGPVTDDNWLEAQVAMVVDDPPAEGEKDTVWVEYETGQWLAAIAYNEIRPTHPSAVSNTIQVFRPVAITDLNFER